MAAALSQLFHVSRSHHEGGHGSPSEMAGSLSAGTEIHGRAKRAAIILCNE